MKPRLRDRFIADTEDMSKASVLVVAVQLPSGAIEVITNTQDLQYKAEYYLLAYDKDFVLKSNAGIKIINYMVV